MTRFELTHARAELSRLLAYGQLVYTTAQELTALRSTLRIWTQELGVELHFDPDTPADLLDYLGGAALGAVEGAFAGGLFGLLLGALVGKPGAGMALGATLGGTLGAASGAAAVVGGVRVRINARRTDHGTVAALEVL